MSNGAGNSVHNLENTTETEGRDDGQTGNKIGNNTSNNYTLYDLALNSMPLKAPSGKIEWGVAHLHKGTSFSRRGGEMILESPPGPYTSAGLRIFIKTVPNEWYLLHTRARLEKGDQAFILAQDVRLSYTDTRTKPVLGEALVPRRYFYKKNKSNKYKKSKKSNNSNKCSGSKRSDRSDRSGTADWTYPREYTLYFKAKSEHTIIGLLFYRNFVSYKLAITDFICYSIGHADHIYKRFPLLEPITHHFIKDNGGDTLARLAPYLRKYGVGPNLDTIELFPLEVSGLGGQLTQSNHSTMSDYLTAYWIRMSLGSSDKGKARTYLYLGPYTRELSFEEAESPYLLQLRASNALLKLKSNEKLEIIVNGKPGTLEIRVDSSNDRITMLIYRPKYQTFYPKLQLGSLCIPLTEYDK